MPASQAFALLHRLPLFGGRWMRPAIAMLFAFAPCLLFAQPSLQFTRYGVGEGLPQNSVYGLMQDRTGFLWAATGDGLARYDGQRFVSFRVASRRVPAGATVVYGPLTEDRWGRVWASIENDLLVMNPHRGHALPVSRFISALRSGNGRPTVVGVGAGDTLWAQCGGRLAGISLRSGGYAISSPGVGRVGSAVLVGGEVYYATVAGVFRYHSRTHIGSLVWAQRGIRTLLALPDGRLATSTATHIHLYHPATGRVRSYPLGLESSAGQMVYHAPAQTIYFLVNAAGLGSLHLPTGRVAQYRHDATDVLSLASDLALVLFLDRSENLWVGTEGSGLCRADLKPPKFNRYPDARAVRRGATGLMVKSVFKNGNDILAGTFDSGMHVVDAGSGNLKARMPEPDFRGVASPASRNILYRDVGGRLWSNVGHLIGLLDERTYRFTPVAAVPREPNQVPGNFSVYTFLECNKTIRSKRYLLGTNYSLALLEEDASGARIRRLENLPPDHYYALQALPDGTHLAGRLRGGWVRFSLDEAGGATLLGQGFAHTGIRDFHLGKTSPLLFAASEDGLIVHHLLTGVTRVLDERDGLSNAHLYGILAENDTALWISSNRGLNRIAFRYGADVMPTDISIAVYGEKDGLQSAEFNSGAFSRAQDGTLLFGGINGINWTQPATVRANPYAPAVVLTGVSVNEKVLVADTAAPSLHSIILPHDKNTLAIRFAALEYTEPEAALYSYRLDGFEASWTPPGRVTEARYAGLPPGRYTFLLRAANADGVWNHLPLRLPVEIRPPWWGTWWARVLGALLLVAGIAVGIRQYVQARVRRRLREIEKEKAVNEERLRISRDMHDDLGSGLTKIALLSEVTKQRMARSQSGGDAGLLEQIAATSRSLTEKMGEIIWTLNPAADTLDNLAAYLKEYLSELSEGLTVRLCISFPENVPALSLSNRQRQSLLLVTKEAVNNAVKYAGASTVTVTMRADDEEVRFSVADDGAGFQHDGAQMLAGKRNGLRNMKARMESIGGHCSITSAVGDGTVVEYSIGHRL